MNISIIFSILVAITSLIFAFQNNDSVTVSFFNQTFSGSLALIIIASLLAGFIIGVFLMIPTVVRARWQAKKQQRDIADLNKELEESGTITYESEGLDDSIKL